MKDGDEVVITRSFEFGMRAVSCRSLNSSVTVRYFGAGDVPAGSSGFKSRERASGF